MTSAQPKSVVGNSFAKLRLGIRAHDFGCDTAERLAARIAAQGFSCVQLALNKAIVGLNLQGGDLTPEIARKIGGAFARHSVGIEVLGCYINPIHPDLATRKKLLAYFKDHLRFARDFGCGIVALESGSVNADYSPQTANYGESAFQEMLTSIGELVAEAERFGVCVGLEAVHCHTVSTAQKMRRVLDTIRSQNLRVVFDPANLLTQEIFHEQSRIIPEALDLLGNDIAVVHAKDLVYENGSLKAVPVGCGELDFAPVLQFVRSLKSNVSVLLEETGEPAAPAAADFLRKQFEEI